MSLAYNVVDAVGANDRYDGGPGQSCEQAAFFKTVMASLQSLFLQHKEMYKFIARCGLLPRTNAYE